MRVRVKCNLGTDDFPDSPLTEGEHEVSETFGAQLVGLKLADEVAAELPPVKVLPTEIKPQEPASVPEPEPKPAPIAADKSKTNKK